MRAAAVHSRWNFLPILWSHDQAKIDGRHRQRPRLRRLDIAEEYIDDECLMVISQENGFHSLDVEFLPRGDGKTWGVKYDIVIEPLRKCRERLWEMRRIEPGGAAAGDGEHPCRSFRV
jgi:hypothetical protein